MSIAPPMPPGSEPGSPATPNSVSQALRGLEAGGSPLLRGVLPVLPWLVLSMGIVGFVAKDPMHGTGMIAVAGCLFLFRWLLGRVPNTFGTLWNRSIIIAKPLTARTDKASTEGLRNAKGTQLIPSLREEQFVNFIREFGGLFNRQTQWEVGAGLGLLGVSWRLLYMTQQGTFIFVKPYVDPNEKHFVDLITGPMSLVLEYLIGFVLGLLAWRMLVIGIEVSRLRHKFDLRPQLQHPDRCGGLKPLGSLCLFNALIITIPGVYLGSWIIFAPSIELPGVQYRQYINLFSSLLLVPITLAVISFFLPLWNVHQLMVAKRAVMQQRLDHLGLRINDLASKILKQAPDLNPEDGEKMTKRLDLMRQVYEQNQHYPVWPFDLGITIKFVLLVTAQVLGLAKPFIIAVFSFLIGLPTQSQ